ncbi:RteC domain-containing protein [Maribacter sp. R86514]|uniref:RteC domain-containing protein n=1 Tax=Maribacter sp. R86514 TaxID=3093854 RepID=UPI0037CA11FF
MNFKQKILNLNSQLSVLNSKNDSILFITDKAITLCRDLLSEFNKEILANGFNNTLDEIRYFKEYKLVPLSNLVYYFDIKSFELFMPKGYRERQKKYIEKKLDKFNKFYVKNIEFFQYIGHGKTYLDEHYFTTKCFNDINITHSQQYFRNSAFCSSHDLLLAKYYANKRMLEYVGMRLANLGNPNGKNCNLTLNKLNWTGSKVDMTELGYALKYHGSVNNGNSSVNEIIQQLEQVFNFSSGDPYKNYSEMRMRKKSRTKFLDELAIGLQTKMGNEDR